MRPGLAALAAASLLLAAAPVAAHHSFSAEFDADKRVEQTGLVTKIEWLNPHVWFFIDVTGDDGTVTNWGWEMGSPNLLIAARLDPQLHAHRRHRERRG